MNITILSLNWSPSDRNKKNLKYEQNQFTKLSDSIVSVDLFLLSKRQLQQNVKTPLLWAEWGSVTSVGTAPQVAHILVEFMLLTYRILAFLSCLNNATWNDQKEA